MNINSLLMDEKDNVVTCVAQIEKGDSVAYRQDQEIKTLIAKDVIPFCHKIALVDLKKGDLVYKYGEVIGETLCDIARGHLVDHSNIYSIPRDYDSELL